jgi:hypothetical protein
MATSAAGSKSTIADHIAAYERQTGKAAIKAAAPELPTAMVHVWKVWLDLHATRQSGMGIEPITYLEIEARARLLHSPLLPCEVVAIRKVDDAYRMHANEAAKTVPGA